MLLSNQTQGKKKAGFGVLKACILSVSHAAIMQLLRFKVKSQEKQPKCSNFSFLCENCLFALVKRWQQLREEKAAFNYMYSCYSLSSVLEHLAFVFLLYFLCSAKRLKRVL